jgi:hypothetical protein
VPHGYTHLFLVRSTGVAEIPRKSPPDSYLPEEALYWRAAPLLSPWIVVSNYHYGQFEIADLFSSQSPVEEN